MLKELGIEEVVNIEVKNKQLIITNTKQMRTKEEIKELLKETTGDDQLSQGIRWALLWVLREDVK